MLEERQGPEGSNVSRRRILRAGLAGLAAAGAGLFLTELGCNGNPGTGAAERLLLTPGDLGSDLHVTQQPSEHQTRDGGRAAMVAFAGPGVDLIESVAVFPTESAARKALAALRAQAGQRHSMRAIPEMRHGTMVLHGPHRTSAFFRVGAAVVRLSYEGGAPRQRMALYLKKARVKASR